MLGSKLGHVFDPHLIRVTQTLFGNKPVNPDIITIMGTVFSCISCGLIISDHLVSAGFSLLIAGFCDMLDGAVARSFRSVSFFGGFLDSVLDRYSDLLVVGGMLVYYILHNSIPMAILVFVMAVGTAIIPYTRARAEAISVECRSGLLERPERIVLLLLGLFFNALLDLVVIISAVLTHITVFQRIIHVKRVLKNR